jgi:1-deoxy-D-xylulose-5-phosphate reductoisomerase
MDGVGLNPIVVLGATGSIGRQTLDVARRLDLEVVGLAARRPSPALHQLAQEWPGARVAVAREADVGDPAPPSPAGPLSVGEEAVAELAATPGVVVVNGIVGAAGLRPSVAALEAGNRLALANKESLVAGGPVVMAALRAGGGELLPIDSEHSALWQCVVGEETADVARIILTASGGPFRGRTPAELTGVSVDEALAHPTWSMGPRITIDSATLMNKAFEVIEAHHLFGLGYEDIDVVVHPQSIVHSLVEFCDGSIKAQLGDPDMRHPIQYSLTYPRRVPAPATGFDLTRQDLTFEAPDRVAFPCLDLGYRAGRSGGTAGAVLNAADEVAVAAFLEGRIPFVAIPEVVAGCLDAVPATQPTSVADVLAADAAARDAAMQMMESLV